MRCVPTAPSAQKSEQPGLPPPVGRRCSESMQLQGWHRDPFGNHDERWFSEGQLTNIVRDHGIESYDEPPQDRLPPYPGDPQPPGR